MAEFLMNNVFRIFTFSLNYLSPSIIADIVLHPFDFATVLLQIGYDPDGLKNEATTLVSALAQYALFTFYIPYLFTSMQGVQFMGLPHPSMFYYVSYIYNREGIFGCYRGVLPKICERIVMMYVNETVKQAINGAPVQRPRSNVGREQDEDKLLQSVVNNLCSQFFAVVASHPFHVIMITSFAEFMYDKKSSMFELAQTIYDDEGCYGFFIGLTPRLIGELLSLTFSGLYTGIINKQMRSTQEQAIETVNPSNGNNVAAYFTDVTRFSAFMPRTKEFGVNTARLDTNTAPTRKSQYLAFFNSFLANLTQNQAARTVSTRRNSDRQQDRSQTTRITSVLTYLPLTSKYFYYMMVRDYISKKISYPFFMVCHCMVVLDSGWDKIPLQPYLGPLIIVLKALIPRKKRDL